MGLPQAQAPQEKPDDNQPVVTNSIGQVIGGDNSAAGKARQRAATATEVGSK